MSPTLFNIYINELATILEKSTAPGLTLHDSEIKFLLYADDLVLLSPTKQGLQQNLDLLEQYSQTWALAVNMKKTKKKGKHIYLHIRNTQIRQLYRLQLFKTENKFHWKL